MTHIQNQTRCTLVQGTCITVPQLRELVTHFTINWFTSLNRLWFPGSWFPEPKVWNRSLSLYVRCLGPKTYHHTMILEPNQTQIANIVYLGTTAKSDSKESDALSSNELNPSHHINQSQSHNQHAYILNGTNKFII